MKPAAIAILLNAESDQVLLVKRRDLPVWVLPGGGIDDGETPEQAVAREVNEETGLHVVVIAKSAEYSPINCWTSTTHVFLCRQESGSLTPSAESADVRFFAINSLPPELFCYHAHWLHEALDPALAKPIRAPLSRKIFWQVIKTYATQPIIALRYLLTKLGLPINS